MVSDQYKSWSPGKLWRKQCVKRIWVWTMGACDKMPLEILIIWKEPTLRDLILQ